MCILLVDDEPVVLMVMQDVLEDAGHEVVAATDGVEAYRLLDVKPCRFSAVVTDHHMPRGISGPTLIERVRSIYPKLPVVLATALGSATTVEWRTRHNVVLLEKPYAPAALVALLAQLTGMGM